MTASKPEPKIEPMTAIDLELGTIIESGEVEKEIEVAEETNGDGALIPLLITQTQKLSLKFLRTWHPSAFVLIVEERRCRSCEQITIIGNTHVLIEYTNNIKGSSRCLKSRHVAPPPPPSLPRKIQKVYHSTDACVSCFDASNEQMHLFPRIKKRAYRAVFATETPVETKKLWEELLKANELAELVEVERAKIKQDAARRRKGKGRDGKGRGKEIKRMVKAGSSLNLI